MAEVATALKQWQTSCWFHDRYVIMCCLLLYSPVWWTSQFIISIYPIFVGSLWLSPLFTGSASDLFKKPWHNGIDPCSTAKSARGRSGNIFLPILTTCRGWDGSQMVTVGFNMDSTWVERMDKTWIKPRKPAGVSFRCHRFQKQHKVDSEEKLGDPFRTCLTSVQTTHSVHLQSHMITKALEQ